MVNEDISTRNKQVVCTFWDALFQGDMAMVAGLMAPDFKWFIPSTDRFYTPEFQQRGLKNSVRDRDEAIQGLAFFVSETDRRQLQILSETAEEDRVAIQIMSYAHIRRNNREYRNHYVNLYRVANGLLTEWYEYQDTLHVFDVWQSPLADWQPVWSAGGSATHRPWKSLAV